MSKRSLAQVDFESTDNGSELPELKKAKPTQMPSAGVPTGTHTIDFSKYSGSAWYALNKKYKSSKDSVEYENSWAAASEVKDCVGSIRRQATLPSSSFGTKRSALETPRKIGKSVTLAPSTLGSEVIKQFQYEDCVEDAMKKILLGMSAAEVKQVAQSADEKGMFVDKVDELQASAAGLCIMEGLEEILNILDDAIDGVLELSAHSEGASNQTDLGAQKEDEPEEESDESREDEQSEQSETSETSDE